MRLFLAIEIPDDVKDKLVSLQKQIRPLIRAKNVERENLHVTLKFLGEVHDMKILEPLKETKFQPFRASLSKLGVFPSPNYIRIVWVGIKQGADRIIRLHNEIESKIPFEKDRNYHPHVTLARVKSAVDEKAKKELFSKSLDDEFEIREFVLYRSTLTPSGPFYEKVASFPSQP